MSNVEWKNGLEWKSLNELEMEVDFIDDRLEGLEDEMKLVWASIENIEKRLNQAVPKVDLD